MAPICGTVVAEMPIVAAMVRRPLNRQEKNIMALLNVLFSGGWRLSSTSDLITKGFSAQTPLTAALGSLSTFVQQEIVIAAGVSEFLVSYSQLSAPQFIGMTATATVRVNFAGWASNLSAASASVVTFREGLMLMSISGTLPSALHFANSGTDSSTITLCIAG
jgi:hypothetical protein